MANHILSEEIRELTRLEEVQLTVKLPASVAAQARELQMSDPEYLSRILLFGLTRSNIYQQLQEERAAMVEAGLEAAGL